MTDLNELLERVRGATGPDREIDLAVKISVASVMISEGRSRSEVFAAVGSDLFDAPAYTASIEAACALTQHALPARWEIAMGTCGEEDMPWACLTEPDEPCRDFSANAPTMELAIVEALLSAVIAIGDQS